MTLPTASARILELESKHSIDAIAARDEQPDERGGAAARSEREPPRDVNETYGGDLCHFMGSEAESVLSSSQIYLCDGMVARGEPNLILGEPKIGKTLVVEDLAVCLAAGLPDFCGRPIYGRARVLLMTREDSDRTTRSRLWQIMRARDTSPRALSGHLEVDGHQDLQLDTRSDVAKLRRTLARFDAVFIDSLSTIHSGDENSAREMRPVTNAWRSLAVETNTAIVLVHHLRKPTELSARSRRLNRGRGSTAIGATARHILFLSDGPGTNQLAVAVDGNFFGMPEPFVIERQVITDDTGHSVKHEVAGNANVGRGTMQTAQRDASILDARPRSQDRHDEDARTRVLAVMHAANVALSQNKIAIAASGRRADNIAALNALLVAGEVVQVEGRRTGGSYPYALTSRLEDLSLRPIGRGNA